MKLGALEKLASETSAPARMTVIDVDTEKPLKDSKGNDCYIEFLSIDSEAGRKLDRERNLATVRKLRSGRNRQDDEEDPVDVQVDTLVALATGWHFGDDAEAFSKESARALFAAPDYGWLRRQGYTFVHTTANFIKRSSKDSSGSASTTSGKPAS